VQRGRHRHLAACRTRSDAHHAQFVGIGYALHETSAALLGWISHKQHQVADSTIQPLDVVVVAEAIDRRSPHPGAAGPCCRRSSQGASWRWWFQKLLISWRSGRHAPDRCRARTRGQPRSVDRKTPFPAEGDRQRLSAVLVEIAHMLQGGGDHSAAGVSRPMFRAREQRVVGEACSLRSAGGRLVVGARTRSAYCPVVGESGCSQASAPRRESKVGIQDPAVSPGLFANWLSISCRQVPASHGQTAPTARQGWPRP